MSKEAQDLFDAFKRTMPTHWSGTSIVVADSVVIAAPYGVGDCKTLNLAGRDEVAGTALTRVRKVVSSPLTSLLLLVDIHILTGTARDGTKED